nr:thioesterase domain-containing protein [Photobacterium leiognathi]
MEAAILDHPDIDATVVVMDKGSSGEKELAAYFCTSIVPTPEWIAQLRQALFARLPEFMVPVYFTPIDEIPLNISGKLDRRRLPAISRQQVGAHGYQPPRTRVELALIEAYQEVLGIKQVGITDNFFQIGGHSLLALRLATIIESKLGKPVEIVDIFRYSTPRELAETFTRDALNLDKETLLTISETGSDEAIFLVHPVFGLAYPYLALSNCMQSERIYGLNNPAFGHEQGRFASIEQQAENYVSEIQKVQPQGPYRLGGWSYGGIVAYEMAQILRAQGQEVERLVLIDSFFASSQNWQQPDNLALQSFMFKEGVDPKSAFGKAFSVELRHTPALLMNYQPSAYEGRVDYLQASRKRDHDNPLIFDNLSNDWQRLVKGEFYLYHIDATHDDLFKEDKIEQTANVLRQIFSRQDVFSETDTLMSEIE